MSNDVPVRAVVLHQGVPVAPVNSVRREPGKPPGSSVELRQGAVSRRRPASMPGFVRSAPPLPIDLAPDDAPLPKSPLTRKQLKEFERLLLAKRAEVVGDVRHMTDEALSNRQGASGETTNMPLHMADVGTDNWEQQVTLGLVASESKLVREIDEALRRIRTGVYGVCLATHRPIGLDRLRAKPWARYCIEYARLRDEGRVPP